MSDDQRPWTEEESTAFFKETIEPDLFRRRDVAWTAVPQAYDPPFTEREREMFEFGFVAGFVNFQAALLAQGAVIYFKRPPAKKVN